MSAQRLSVAECGALIVAATFLQAGEWNEIITASENASLTRAVEKLRVMMSASDEIKAQIGDGNASS